MLVVSSGVQSCYIRFHEHSIASEIVSGLGTSLELDSYLGLSLDLLFLRLFSISIPVILSDRNNYG